MIVRFVPTSPRRRAAALAAAIAVIALLNFVIVGSLVAGADDASIVAHRFESMRALHAAESGAALVIGEVSAGRAVPSGSRVLPSGQTIDIQTDAETLPLTAEITGISGLARRVIRIRLE
ncbi:MAG: hypothetical protein ACFHWZ_00060 [Phycisphaerales bacterium]